MRSEKQHLPKVNENVLLTIPEAAVRLRRSTATLRAWVSQRKIAFVRIGGGVLIPESVITDIVARGYVSPRSEDAE
jgi:excisionase family DNA binding protein